jgi:hypothetical protein
VQNDVDIVVEAQNPTGIKTLFAMLQPKTDHVANLHMMQMSI